MSLSKGSDEAGDEMSVNLSRPPCRTVDLVQPLPHRGLVAASSSALDRLPVLDKSWWRRGQGPLGAHAEVGVDQTKSQPSLVPPMRTCLARSPRGPKLGEFTIQPPVNLGKPGASLPKPLKAR